MSSHENILKEILKLTNNYTKVIYSPPVKSTKDSVTTALSNLWVSRKKTQPPQTLELVNLIDRNEINLDSNIFIYKNNHSVTNTLNSRKFNRQFRSLFFI